MGDQRPMNRSPQIVIITDGACRGNPGPGGWAFSIVERGPDGEEQVTQQSGAEPATTNNRMELTAAINALVSLGSTSEPIIVQSDVSLR